MFRLLIAAGVTVDKWTRLWAERVPGTELIPVTAAPDATLDDSDDRADAGLLRLPVDRDVFHAVPLYTEKTVVVVPRDHFVAAGEEVTMADLADEPLLHPLDDVLTWPAAPSAAERPPTTADAVPLVAAHAGLLVVPQSLARLHHRRDLTYRVVTDAPTSTVGLVWRQDGYSDLVEELIGIVRGRTANSTRGRAEPAPEPGTRSAPRSSPRSAPRRPTGRRRR